MQRSLPLREIQGHLVLLVHKVFLDRWAHLVLMVHLVFLVLRAPEENWDLEERKEVEAFLGLMDHQQTGCKQMLVLVGALPLMHFLACQGHLVHLVNLERRETKEKLGQFLSMIQNQMPKWLLDLQVPKEIQGQEAPEAKEERGEEMEEQ